MGRIIVAAAAAALAAFGISSATAGAAPVKNGGFERGNLSGWNEVHAPAECGSWAAFPTEPPLLPRGGGIGLPQGGWGALTIQECESRQILSQVVKLRKNRKHRLRFLLAYDAFMASGRGKGAEGFLTPPSLSFGIPNQQFRMDVLRPGAPKTSVKRKHVLKRVYRTNVGDPGSRTFSPVSANLSRLAGKKVRLRFAVVVTEGPIEVGLDSVKIKTKRRR